MVGVGLVGVGFMGGMHFRQYEQLTDRAKLVAICDTEPDRRAGDWSKVGGNIGDPQANKRDLKGVAQYEDYKQLIADPNVQLVDICVPTYMHCEIASAALKAGKHVLSEKPMALTVEECDGMLALAAESSGKFMIGQCVRFWPECAWLKDAIDDKRYGALKTLHLRRQASTPDYSLNDWLLDPTLSGGAILDLHVHDTDYALFLLGKPKAVTAQAYQRVPGSYDRVHALWHYNPELIVQIEGAWDLPSGFGFNMGFTAVFEDAAAIMDMNTGKPLTVFKKDGSTETPQVGGNDGYFNEIVYFLDCIEKGQSPQVSTPAESREAVALALAEKESAKIGQTVSIA
jgi:predicted dehydrogenase